MPVSGSTLLSGAAGTNSLASGFASGDTITVNGKTISFYNSSTTPPTTAGGAANTTYLDLATETVQGVLSAIDTISGTTALSTVSSGGVVTLNDNAGNLSVTSSNSATLAALGFSGPVTANQPTVTSGTTTTLGTATASGTVIDSQATALLPITGATSLSGATGTNTLSSSFANGNTITVNGKTITFSSSAPTSTNANGGVINLTTGSVQDVLSAIDAISGTSTPSAVSGGVIALHTDNSAGLSITSSNAAAFQALGFTGTVTAAQPPLRVGPGSPPTTLVSGASNTVAWYTGNSGPGSARDSSIARIDSSETVDFGAQANEQAIRTQLQNIAVFAAFTASPTGTNSAAQIGALSASIATNLTPQAGQQSISDMQTDFANAQTQIQAATARQTQTQTMMQNMIDTTENVSTDQVASELLAVQNSLQASYQATSMLAQLSLTKYLSPGG